MRRVLQRSDDGVPSISFGAHGCGGGCDFREIKRTEPLSCSRSSSSRSSARSSVRQSYRIRRCSSSPPPPPTSCCGPSRMRTPTRRAERGREQVVRHHAVVHSSSPTTWPQPSVPRAPSPTSPTPLTIYALDVAQVPSARLTSLFLCDIPGGGASYAARTFAASFGKTRVDVFGADFQDRPESCDDSLLAAAFRRADAAVFDRQDSERLARLYAMARSGSPGGHFCVKTRQDVGHISPTERAALHLLFVRHSKTRFREIETLTGLRSTQLGRALDVVLARRYCFLAVQFPREPTGAAHYWHYRAPSPAAIASRTMGRRVFATVPAPSDKAAAAAAVSTMASAAASTTVSASPKPTDGDGKSNDTAIGRRFPRSLSETIPDDAIEIAARHLWLPDAVALYSTTRTLYRHGTAYLARAVSPSEDRREFPDGVTFVFSCTVPDCLRPPQSRLVPAP